MSNGLSVILPAYNEEANIKHAIADVVNYFLSRGEEYEVIVVNDGSKDRTKAIADRMAKENSRVRVIHHETNVGYGRALYNGFTAAKYDYVFFTDSDRQFDIKSLDVLLPLAKTDVMDLIIGYRIDRKDPFIRRFLSWGYNTVVGFIFDLNIKDIDCAFKIFRKHIFDKIKIESKNFFVNTEVLAKARFYNFNILEVGVRHFPRKAGKSTVSFKYIPLTIKELFRIGREIRELKKEPRAKDESTACQACNR